MQVGEITAAAAGNQNLFADLLTALDDQNAPAAFARLDGAHQTGRATTDNDYIIGDHQMIKTKEILSWVITFLKFYGLPLYSVNVDSAFH